MTSVPAQAGARSDRVPYILAGAAITLAAIAGLFYYKWGGAFHTMAAVRGKGAWTGNADKLTTGGPVAESLFYLHRIWIALLYGLLIGAAVCAFISPQRVVRLLGVGGPVRRQISGGLAGAPLMLCSCCITPIFQSVYEQGAELRSALSLMLASPGLNPAALILTFILFPAPIAAARLVAGLVLVFGLPPLVERRLDPAFTASRTLFARPADEDFPRTVRTAFTRYLQALGYLAVRTVPLVIVGVLISSLILPLSATVSAASAGVAVVVVAAVAVLVALPTFFEIPLALVFLKLGLPGAAVAMLIAGPIVNLPSLLILARETRPRVALGLAAGVWAIAVTAGLLLSA